MTYNNFTRGVAVPVVLPLPGQRMVMVAHGKWLIGNQHSQRFCEIGVECLSVPALAHPFVVALENSGAPNRPHSGRP